MRRLVITIAASAAILFLIPTGWSANAMTGPGPSKALPDANYTLRHEAGCRGGWGRYGCGPGFVRRCNRWRCWCGPCWWPATPHGGDTATPMMIEGRQTVGLPSS